MSNETVAKRRLLVEQVPGLEKKSHANVVEIRVYYDLGGTNFATSSAKPRGYYLSVQPLEVKGNWVSFVGFSGKYALLNTCARKNQKAVEKALEIAKDKEQMVVEAVLKEQNLRLRQGERL